MEDAKLDKHIEVARRFSRFYNRNIGALYEGLLGSPFSLTEGRVLAELARHKKTTASNLGNELGLDPGYLSRILQNFRVRGLIGKESSQVDGRLSIIFLTNKGQKASAVIDTRSRVEITMMLKKLSTADQNRLIEALDTAEKLLGGDASQP